MKGLYLAIGAIFALSASQESKACSCTSLGDDFFTTVSLHNQHVADGDWPQSAELTIITGEVVGHLSLRPGPTATEMVVAVTHVIQGEEVGDYMIIEGDNGIQCRPYVSNFPIGEKFILAVNPIDSDQSDAYISVCGVYSQSIAAP
jgi:hypothetical protein